MALNIDQFNSKLPLLTTQLNGLGMDILGLFETDDYPVNKYNEVTHLGVIVANMGGRMWSVFQQSNIYHDGGNNRLDRWTAGELRILASKFGAELILPFTKPYFAFQRWAKLAGNCQDSPLGILVHADYGLWIGLRGALFFEVNVKNQLLQKLIQEESAHSAICCSCVDKPCLRACPVNAFRTEEFDAVSCRNHLDIGENSICNSQGCLARNACPVGHGHRYSISQQTFHMSAFKQV